MTGETAQKHLHRSEVSSLVCFYVLAFGISWLGFVPTVASALGETSFRSIWWQVFLILPAIGPAAAALIATRRSLSPGGMDEASWVSLKGPLSRPVPSQWWAVAVVLSVGSMLAAAVLSSGIHQARVISNASVLSVTLFSVMSIAANPLEEVGWRGFAQRRLQRTLSPLAAAVMVGVFWAVWHVPLFLLVNNPMSMAQVPFWPWAAGVVPQAILLAWLYNATNHSLAVVSVFHVLGNISGEMLHPSIGMVSAVRIAAALLVIGLTGTRVGVSLGPYCSEREGVQSRTA